MKKLLIIGAAAMAAVGAFGYTSASYVQDGLIAQWDGIDNAGTGTHDPNAATWKDLAGSYDLSLLAGGSWSTNGNALVANGASAFCSDSLPAYGTIEIVYKMTRDDGRILFQSGNAYRWVIFGYGYASSPDYSPLDGYFTQSNSDDSKKVRWDSFDPSAIRSMAATYSGNDVSAVYGNGLERNDGEGHDNWGFYNNFTIIGDRKVDSADFPWYGEVYAIRIYSRALSAAEIASNHDIDMARFAAPPPVYTSDSYVKDGLVTQWDGIDNAGTGTHDPSATTWKDLVGNIDLTLVGESVGWTGGNALNLVATGDHAFNSNTNLMPEYKTIEVVFRQADNTGRFLFHSGYSNRIVVFDNYTPTCVYFDGSDYTKIIDQPFSASEVCFLAAQYDEGGAVTNCFRDGERWGNDYRHLNDWWSSATISVGAMYVPPHSSGYNDSDQPARMYDWRGEVYAIRLYNRRLTKWELAYNNMIDRRRFLTSRSYIQSGLTVQWDGIDNAGRGVHDSTTNIWKNLAVEGSHDLTLASGKWLDNALYCVGDHYAACEDGSTIALSTLEVTFKNKAPGAGAILFFNGDNSSRRYCAIWNTYTQWRDNYGATNLGWADTDFTGLSWTESPEAASANGAALDYGSINDWWSFDQDANRVVVGGRTASSYPFTGHIYAIRIYGNSLTAHEVAYNAKVDDARYFQPNGGRAMTWQGPEVSLADGAFGSNGCWKVAGKKWGSRDIPTVGDTAILPAGDYTVTLDEATWSLRWLSIGAGAKLRLPALPADASNAVISVSSGVAADATAGLVISANAFGKKHPNGTVTLIECAKASAVALQNLADHLEFVDTIDRRKGSVAVVDGTKLVYTAPPPPGTKLIVR